MIEKILRQLESQKENIDQQRIIVQQILSKFPTDVIVKLEESKRLNESWTVASLRESLKDTLLFIQMLIGMGSCRRHSMSKTVEQEFLIRTDSCQIDSCQQIC